LRHQPNRPGFSVGGGLSPPARAPIVSATRAPRIPSGVSPRTVVSTAVWCSISALISAPRMKITDDIHTHIMKPMTAPKEPYMAL